MQRIILGSDHRGFLLKSFLIKFLKDSKVNIVDCGANASGLSVDYPDIAYKTAKEVLSNDSMGVLICNSGIGMSIAANRIRGIRAALCRTVKDAKLARKHNNANILVLGSASISESKTTKIMNAFLSTKFEGGRHEERIKKLEG